VISTNVSADNPQRAFGFLRVHFVPEPATAVLVAGAAALLAAARRRRAPPG
jgi:hypothetical protein